jgi:beta-lactam-binding protein with PASTA domain
MSDLQTVGLTGTVTSVSCSDPSSAGTVIAQSPSAGSKVAKGASVNMSVCKQGGTTTTTGSSGTLPFG